MIFRSVWLIPLVWEGRSLRVLAHKTLFPFSSLEWRSKESIFSHSADPLNCTLASALLASTQSPLPAVPKLAPSPHSAILCREHFYLLLSVLQVVLLSLQA
uniref:Uncharacterized protein n=1 Tax=Cacopsylla melanoneura TaxID=428564 RepID=A0A8D8ZE58_9HEMI